VASEAEARFYDMERFGAPLELAGQITDPNARLHDRDFKSDRPGRVFDHAPSGTQRRGSVAHHGVNGENRPRKHEAVLFARRITDELEKARRAGLYNRLVLVVGPPFLGVLRKALPKSLKSVTLIEVPHNLVKARDSMLRAQLSRAARASLW
jgi:protein required for attachment to host cells